MNALTNFTEIQFNFKIEYTFVSIYAQISSMCVLLGFVGNMFIISLIILNKELHTITSIIIFNLALADLMITMFTSPLSIIGNFELF